MYEVTSQLRGRTRTEREMDEQSAMALFQMRLAEADLEEVLILSVSEPPGETVLAFRTPSMIWYAG